MNSVTVDWQSALSEAHDEIRRLRLLLEDKAVACSCQRQTKKTERQTVVRLDNWNGLR
jgi:hypothetical protein